MEHRCELLYYQIPSTLKYLETRTRKTNLLTSTLQSKSPDRVEYNFILARMADKTHLTHLATDLQQAITAYDPKGVPSSRKIQSALEKM